MSALSLPELKLDHLLRLTDCTGIIQHAAYTLPDRATGYTTDDNARALIAALRVHEAVGDPRALGLAERYLGFLAWVQNGRGGFRNFVAYDRRFLEEEGSEDAFGRAFWALGCTLGMGEGFALARNARRLAEAALPRAGRLRSPRARAFTLLGLAEWLEAGGRDPRIRALLRRLADGLVRQYRTYAGPGWRWFEDLLTYSNGVLPLALFVACAAGGGRDHLAVAVESLDFLGEVLFRDGPLRLVGNRGWYPRGGAPALFDEQPEDAGAMVLAYAAAHRVTGRDEYRRLAGDAFAWFLGRNALGVALYDPATGGCCDGLTPDGPNLNQGAESLLAYLLAHLALGEIRSETRERLVLAAGRP